MRKIIKSDTGWRVSGVRGIFFPEMTDAERKTVFLLSEESGEKTPKGVLRLIGERGLVFLWRRGSLRSASGLAMENMNSLKV